MPAFRPIVYPPPSIEAQQAAVSLARRNSGIPIGSIPRLAGGVGNAPALTGVPVRPPVGGGTFLPHNPEKFR